LRGDRHPEQTAAMVPPSVLIKTAWASGGRPAATTVHPDELRMQQMARNATMEGSGLPRDRR
jgi:hypothetical protein